MCSESPDTSGMNRAAEANAAIGKDALDWYKQLYADTAPDRARATATALDQSDLQTQLSKDSLARSTEQYDRYKNTFQPVEDKIVSDAMAYDTPERREAAAAAAGADASTALAGQRAATTRNLERSGVAPNSGQNLSLQAGLDVGGARNIASAENVARRNVETVGSAKMMDAAGLGRGTITNQGTQAQLGLQAGNSGVQNSTVPLNVQQQGASTMQQGFNTGVQGNTSAGSLYGQAAGVQQQSNSSSAAGLGNLAMAGAMFFSDENMKENISEPVEGREAMDAVRLMPVKNWNYKADSPAADGGQPHVGPMAQDVQAAAGDAAAPGGTKLDLVTMNGITLAAVQHLDEGQRRLEKKVVSLSQQINKTRRKDEEAETGKRVTYSV